MRLLDSSTFQGYKPGARLHCLRALLSRSAMHKAHYKHGDLVCSHPVALWQQQKSQCRWDDMAAKRSPVRLGFFFFFKKSV